LRAISWRDMTSLRTTLMIFVIFMTFLFVSCSGQYSASVSPSTNSNEVPLERLGDDWDDESQTAEEDVEIDFDYGETTIVT